MQKHDKDALSHQERETRRAASHPAHVKGADLMVGYRDKRGAAERARAEEDAGEQILVGERHAAYKLDR